MKNLVLGTWRFEKINSSTQVAHIIRCAKALGIKTFDTALVYGKGAIERTLGEETDLTDTIITKIPAKSKPALNDGEERFDELYSDDHIEICVKKSLENLCCDTIGIILYHNWSRGWGARCLQPLVKLKERGLAKQIGISLPNNYLERLSDEVIDMIEAVELPYNPENTWSGNDIAYYQSKGLVVYLRSIFSGKGITTTFAEMTKFVNDRISSALKFEANVIIGVSTIEQLFQDVRIVSLQKNLTVNKSPMDDTILVHGGKTERDYNLNVRLFGALSGEEENILSCVGVSNNSLSVDLWRGCQWQCRYCHVQGCYADIFELGRLSATPQRKKRIGEKDIVSAIIAHPFFDPNTTIISISTSSTEPFSCTEVTESTFLIMEAFAWYGLNNPFWIVTKAGFPKGYGERLSKITQAGTKVIISLCWAGNPVEIEPVQNNRFENINEYDNIKNLYITWYLRPICKEWSGNKQKLNSLFELVHKKYSKNIAAIIPGGLRWTDGIEYAIKEIHDLPMPNLIQDDNTKTLSQDIIDTIDTLHLKYFPNIPLFYKSSCAINYLLERPNFAFSYVKSNCENSNCLNYLQCSHCYDSPNVDLDVINLLLAYHGINIKVTKIQKGSIITEPALVECSYAERQITNKVISLYFISQFSKDKEDK